MTEIELVAEPAIELTETDEAIHAWQAWSRAKAMEAAAKREVAQTRRALDKILGDSQNLYLAGESVASYRNDGAFNEKKFTDDMPHIAAQYTAWKAQEVFDVDRFKADNPGLFEAYRSRTLRVKGE